MITSTSNAKVKRLVNLKKKKKLRDEEGVFLVEGIRMFREVPKDRLVEVYASEEFWNRERKAVEQVLAGTKVQPEILADFVFEYVSDTKTPQGILCLVRQKQYSITEIVKEKGGELPLLLVLDQIQDPGNLGTIVRTAEGAGVTGIVMSQDCVDMYNPKVVRSTMGAAYRVPFCYVDDLVECMLRFMASPVDFTGPMNMGNPGEFTIRELAEKVVALTGSRSIISCEPLPGDDPKQRRPDISLARKMLGWEPVVPLEEGLKKTIAYFEDQLRQGLA